MLRISNNRITLLVPCSSCACLTLKPPTVRRTMIQPSTFWAQVQRETQPAPLPGSQLFRVYFDIPAPVNVCGRMLCAGVTQRLPHQPLHSNCGSSLASSCGGLPDYSLYRRHTLVTTEFASLCCRSNGALCSSHPADTHFRNPKESIAHFANLYRWPLWCEMFRFENPR